MLGLLAYGFSKTSLPPLASYVPKIFGVASIIFSAWLVFFAVLCFYYSYYYKSMPIGAKVKPKMSFELARILYQSQDSDLLLGFFESDEGYKVMIRTGITFADAKDFILKRKIFIKGQDIVLPDGEYVTASDYAVAIFDVDKDFSQFLFAHGIQKKDFIAIIDWVMEREIGKRAKERWWIKERLGRIEGLGKDWSYGQIYDLKKYSRPIADEEGEEYEVHDIFGSKEIKELEAALVRARNANVLIVGDDKAGNLNIVSRFNSMISDGTAMIPLQHKRLISLDTDMISSTSKTKSDFEALFLSLLIEAENAGNVILVFEDFPSLIGSAEVLGSQISSLMDPFLASANLQIIALSDAERFHEKIERNPDLMERFEKVQVEQVDELNTIRILENELIPIELRTNVVFTYPSLVAIAESAERYFPNGIMPDQAINLLFEITPKIISMRKNIVGKDEILELVKVKTGIPMGEVTGDERGRLLNLETILHQKIIGQDEAVVAISNAVRRARSGINNPNRPMASFLFLGPTGVGKTETTKALGEVFFGNNTEILRLDMSEYSAADSVPKLIGSFEGGKTGVLSTMLREHPYGVLLLDEFEKTTPEVMNLFLQILDEGFFSDMSGKHVNARNLLIVATSNAGSDLIWESVKQGNNLSEAKDSIVDAVIKAHIFKPELLNRFDGVIVFHPLSAEYLDKIARLQLERLKKRLAERGINLVINDELVKYLMTFGVDPKFGARPMNRAIQDKIEQVIAEKMIRGDIKPGGEVALSGTDLK